MIKKLLFTVTLLAVFYGYSQQGSISPYSFFGIGEVKFKGTILNQSMGQLGFFSDSIHVNLKNPASYAKLQLTTYSLGAGYTSTTMKSTLASQKTQEVSFDYFAVGLPIGKRLGVGFGVLPYTSVGYKMESTATFEALEQKNQLSGTGGVNKAYLSVGYGITPDLSIGLTTNYDFGKLNAQEIQGIEDVLYASKQQSTATLSGLDFNLAVNYRKTFTNDLFVESAFSYAPKATLRSKNTRERYLVTSDMLVRQSVVEDLSRVKDSQTGAFVDLRTTDVTLPSAYTLGFGVGKAKKWFVGVEYQATQMSAFKNEFLQRNNTTYTDATRFSLGGFIIPKYNSYTNYWSRVAYRAGLRYESLGLKVNNIGLYDFGTSFGVGLPLGGYVPATNTTVYAGLFSNVNIAVEFGKRGTPTLGRVQENYVHLKIGLSLNDKWFVKRKYD